jgi:ligand-binding sensor domain-containing protein
MKIQITHCDFLIMGIFQRKRILILSLLLLISGLKPAYSQDLQWTFFDTLNKSIPYNFITKIAEAPNGTVWAAYSRNSISKYENSKWTTYTCPTKTPWEGQNTNIRDIAFTAENNLVLAGTTGWLLFFNTKLHTWDWKASPDNIQFLKVLCNAQNICLLGSMNGVYEYEKGKFTRLEGDSSDVMGMTLHNNEAWVGFRGGLYHYKCNSKGRYYFDEVFSDLAMYETAFEGPKKFWATSYSTLYLHHFNRFGTSVYDSLPNSIYYNYNGQYRYVVHNVTLDSLKQPIVSTQFGAHVAWLQDKTWQPYTVPIWMRDKVEFDGVSSLLMRSDGSLWIGTWHHGIAILSGPNSPYPKIKVTPKPIKQTQQQPIQQFRDIKILPED